MLYVLLVLGDGIHSAQLVAGEAELIYSGWSDPDLTIGSI